MRDSSSTTQIDDNRAALFRLFLILAAGVFAATLTGVEKTVAVIFAVVLMVMLHELGHFATAKWTGMKVTEFFFGFGKRLWSVTKGETEYGVKAIPAGGYVKIIGMHNLDPVEPEDEPEAYRNKPTWARVLVTSAGSMMHFLLAFLILFALNAFVGVDKADGPLLQIDGITRLTTGPSPAAEAGIKPGDRIVSVDGHKFRPTDPKDHDLPAYVKHRIGEPVRFVIQRAGRTMTVVITPVDRSKVTVASNDKAAAPKPTEPTGFVGIEMTDAHKVVTTNPVRAVGRSVMDLGSNTKLVFKALGSFVSTKGLKSYGDQLTGHATSKQPVADEPRFLSPIGLVQVASVAADNGLRTVLYLLMSINLFVGIFNMIPLLPLDGGHVAIALYEKARSRKGKRYRVDVAKLIPVTTFVFLLIVFIGITALYLDIAHPLKFQ
ncbi:MAG TPA: M50 family metallopeptidase [Acidimicrobiales bacterium]|nr:M50 family metallopeptidase [Acidimicrobiales bacterium]